MIIQRLPLIALTLVAGLGLASCGDDNDDNNTGTQAPQTQPQQPNSIDPLWDQVEWNHEVETTNTPGECVSPRRFMVMQNGTFVAGPCVQNRQPLEGNLTPEELTELNRRMNLMLEAGRGSERVCQEVSIEQEAELKVEPTTGSTYTALSESEAGRCFRGDQTLITSAREYLSQLEDTYYPSSTSPSPSPTGSPSPSPTGSPSPSPTGSPSPSPTASPSPSPSPSPTVTVTPAAEQPQPDFNLAS